MNEIYFKLKPSKADKAGLAPVFLEFNYNSQTLVYATGEKCRLADWDADKQKFRRSMPGYQEANELLEVLRDKLRRAYRDARNTDHTVTTGYLRDYLSGGMQKSGPVLLVPLFDEYTQIRVVEGYKPGKIVARKTTLVRLKCYEAANPLGT